MTHLIHVVMSVIHTHPVTYASLMGFSLLIPFTFYMWDATYHPEHYKEH